MPMLLVIDMQARFGASDHDWLKKNVAREIRDAKLAGWGIMFLEYSRGCDQGGVLLKDRTYGCLTRLVARYDHAITVHKEKDDGSAKVISAAQDWWSNAWATQHIDGGIRVVGVNTEACVAGTVNGISKAEPNIEITVVGDACNGERPNFGGGHVPNNDGQDKIVTKGRKVRVLKVA